MKKVILMLIIMAVMLFTLSACDYNDSYEIKTTTGVPFGCYRLEEWVSPDGVCYWAFSFSRCTVIAPRYTSDGEIAINKEDGF